MQYPGFVRDASGFGDYRINAGLQPCNERRSDRFGAGGLRHPLDIREHIANRLGVQGYDLGWPGQPLTRFGNLPSGDGSHFTDALGQYEIWLGSLQYGVIDVVNAESLVQALADDGVDLTAAELCVLLKDAADDDRFVPRLCRVVAFKGDAIELVL
jgi:hypothetical protein